MGKILKEPDVSDEELEKIVFIYKHLPEAERSQMVYGANLLYASSKSKDANKK